MLTKEVTVTTTVRVTIDETKFDADFMAEFARSIGDFDTLDKHIAYLGWLYATGRADDLTGSFIEGYGPTAKMGIKFADVHNRAELDVRDVPAAPDGEKR